MPEEINTGGWVAPSYDFLQLPEIRIQRGGVMYPMPQLETNIITERESRWWAAGRYFVYLRQYGQEKVAKVGPIPTLSQAKLAEQALRAWYTDVYNVVIRTYKATERNKK